MLDAVVIGINVVKTEEEQYFFKVSYSISHTYYVYSIFIGVILKFITQFVWEICKYKGELQAL